MRGIIILQLLLQLLHVTMEQSLIESFLSFLGEGSQHYLNEPHDVRTFLPTYDFIIVGAGTSGCVIANRLSENPKWNVLLLEAGISENYIMDMPILANYLQFTDANWKYNTMPSDKYCLGMENRQCNWPRGKVVGGSSVLNYMIYTRGNRRDYDNWEKLGNTGWSYRDVLPYFKKVENFSIPTDYNRSYHGSDGYLSVGYAPYRTKLSEHVLEAAMESGLKYVDYDGATQVGVSQLHVSMQDGVRHSSSKAYLHPIRNRSNLHFRKRAMVKRVVIDPVTKHARGVEVVLAGTTYMLQASKEVILAAGAINSPQLLMLSGVGPKKHLTQVGIPLVQNLKVGYNLMDHVAVGGLTFVINETMSIRTQDVMERSIMVNFLSHHKGPLTLPGGCETLTFTDFDNPNDPDGYPNIELLFQAGSLVSDPMLRHNFGITDENYNEIYGDIENVHSYMVLPMLLRPKSRGRIALKDASYRSKPLIYPNYFAHQQDIDTLILGIRQAINISQQPALQAIGTRLHSKPVPGCRHLQFGSDQYWECHVRHFPFTIYHLSGTCKMGPRSDKYAVVDPRLRVHGVTGLRVIDASIMPEITAGHTNAPVYMIAEKGTDMIKEDWGAL
ncbi:hypothetical protein PPYR_03578 [Photinus pyralis]|uniref:Glucose-methanol-choline oxidoreductase N-terminal domain-containing protein n=1 Tax=Photinus pyralis TaxID=7054 RepID=A0A1Y1LJW1_PHOPY|nr:glucose dehydrogenase [FAD, quinone]-like [Photinus pyralis]XP_031330251.1 glucose dehydrogenase [FAD, quinone]-like [Photinus pyralis]XP_031330252.1 glucose dehydrogenase [FAD, quinone]-like [Photinus pyralis]KAB0791778.1 hypothetical protein PPYR_03578 [Photinus pyralis]